MGWDGYAAREPVGQLGVGEFHDLFQLVQFSLGHPGDSRLNEIAYEQIILIRATMLGAVNDPASAGIKGGSRIICHGRLAV